MGYEEEGEREERGEERGGEERERRHTRKIRRFPLGECHDR